MIELSYSSDCFNDGNNHLIMGNVKKILLTLKNKHDLVLKLIVKPLITGHSDGDLCSSNHGKLELTDEDTQNKIDISFSIFSSKDKFSFHYEDDGLKKVFDFFYLDDFQLFKNNLTYALIQYELCKRNSHNRNSIKGFFDYDSLN